MWFSSVLWVMKDAQGPLRMLLPTEQNWQKQGAYCTSPRDVKLALSLPHPVESPTAISWTSNTSMTFMCKTYKPLNKENLIKQEGTRGGENKLIQKREQMWREKKVFTNIYLPQARHYSGSKKGRKVKQRKHGCGTQPARIHILAHGHLDKLI